jgi:hypothetical protein
MLDGTAAEFVKSTEWPPNSSDLNSLDYHVSSETNTICVQIPEGIIVSGGIK